MTPRDLKTLEDEFVMYLETLAFILFPIKHQDLKNQSVELIYGASLAREICARKLPSLIYQMPSRDNTQSI